MSAASSGPEIAQPPTLLLALADQDARVEISANMKMLSSVRFHRNRLLVLLAVADVVVVHVV